MVKVVGVGTVNGINTVVVGTGLKNAVIGVAGLAIACGALRLRLLFFISVLPCILCCVVNFGLGILIQWYGLFY